MKVRNIMKLYYLFGCIIFINARAQNFQAVKNEEATFEDILETIGTQQPIKAVINKDVTTTGKYDGIIQVYIDDSEEGEEVTEEFMMSTVINLINEKIGTRDLKVKVLEKPVIEKIEIPVKEKAESTDEPVTGTTTKEYLISKTTSSKEYSKSETAEPKFISKLWNEEYGNYEGKIIQGEKAYLISNCIEANGKKCTTNSRRLLMFCSYENTTMTCDFNWEIPFIRIIETPWCGVNIRCTRMIIRNIEELMIGGAVCVKFHFYDIGAINWAEEPRHDICKELVVKAYNINAFAFYQGYYQIDIYNSIIYDLTIRDRTGKVKIENCYIHNMLAQRYVNKLIINNSTIKNIQNIYCNSGNVFDLAITNSVIINPIRAWDVGIANCKAKFENVTLANNVTNYITLTEVGKINLDNIQGKLNIFTWMCNMENERLCPKSVCKAEPKIIKNEETVTTEDPVTRDDCYDDYNNVLRVCYTLLIIITVNWILLSILYAKYIVQKRNIMTLNNDNKDPDQSAESTPLRNIRKTRRNSRNSNN